jgi:hypothetical protein
MILRKSTRRSALGLVQKDGKMGVLKDLIEKYASGDKSEPLPNTGCDKTCKETMPPGVNSDWPRSHSRNATFSYLMHQ